MAKLGECFSVIRNGASIRQTDGAGGFPITRIETIADKTINREKFGYAGIYDLAQYRDYILQDGDILMSHINSEKHLGKVALYSKQDDEQIIHGMNLLMLRADTQKVIPEYAKYYFESQKFLRQIGRITKKSVNQASFTVTALKELEIPLASIIVQRDISEKLKKVDWLVSLRKQQLAKLDELVKARFVEMFGDPVVNSKRWPVETIENHIDLLTGFPCDSSGYVSKGVNICGGLIIMPQKIDWSACKHWPQITGYEDYILRPNDIVIALDRPWISNGFKIAMVDREHLPALLIQRTARIRAVDINQHYLMQSLLLGRFDKHCNITGSLVPHISPKDIKSYSVMIPPIELQNQFATFVERVDQQKQTVQQSLEKLELMKKALMQEYFG